MQSAWTWAARTATRLGTTRTTLEWGSFGHGIHLDVEWSGGDVIGRVESPLPGYPGLPGFHDMPQDPNLVAVLQLQNPDNFQRFQAVGRIVERGSPMVPGTDQRAAGFG